VFTWPGARLGRLTVADLYALGVMSQPNTGEPASMGDPLTVIYAYPCQRHPALIEGADHPPLLEQRSNSS
jgi:hypothetical protein